MKQCCYDAMDARRYRQEFWPARQAEHRAEVWVVQKLLPPHMERLLDLGGGYGRLEEAYGDRVDQAVICDRSLAMLLERSPGAASSGRVGGEGATLPFPDQVFDAVLAVRLLHHVREWEAVLGEAHRVLRPEGCLVLEFPNKGHLKNVVRAWAGRARMDPFAAKTEAVSAISQNFHPHTVRRCLEEKGFRVRRLLGFHHLRGTGLARWPAFGTELEVVTSRIWGSWTLGPAVFLQAFAFSDPAPA